MLGATKPSDSAPGTIRGDFALDVGRYEIATVTMNILLHFNITYYIALVIVIYSLNHQLSSNSRLIIMFYLFENPTLTLRTLEILYIHQISKILSSLILTLNDFFRNICHGSDSVENAEKEVALWFPEGVCTWNSHSAPWIYEN
jgi:hypothetical protein